MNTVDTLLTNLFLLLFNKKHKFQLGFLLSFVFFKGKTITGVKSTLNKLYNGVKAILKSNFNFSTLKQNLQKKVLFSRITANSALQTSRHTKYPFDHENLKNISRNHRVKLFQCNFKRILKPLHCI